MSRKIHLPPLNKPMTYTGPTTIVYPCRTCGGAGKVDGETCSECKGASADAVTGDGAGEETR